MGLPHPNLTDEQDRKTRAVIFLIFLFHSLFLFFFLVIFIQPASKIKEDEIKRGRIIVGW